MDQMCHRLFTRVTSSLSSVLVLDLVDFILKKSKIYNFIYFADQTMVFEDFPVWENPKTKRLLYRWKSAFRKKNIARLKINYCGQLYLIQSNKFNSENSHFYVEGKDWNLLYNFRQIQMFALWTERSRRQTVLCKDSKVLIKLFYSYRTGLYCSIDDPYWL